MSTSARVSSNTFIRIGFFWRNATKGRNHEDANRGCCLSIALHPISRMTVNRPWTCSPTAAASATAAISADNVSLSSTLPVRLPATLPVERRAPFARASEAARNGAPRYSWPPHLYQERLSLRERRAKSEPDFGWMPSKKLLQFERFERNVLRRDQQFAAERAFRRPAVQCFFGGETHEIGVVVFLRDVREHQITRDSIESVGIG
jgi:hypothetical protein